MLIIDVDPRFDAYFALKILTSTSTPDCDRQLGGFLNTATNYESYRILSY